MTWIFLALSTWAAPALAYTPNPICEEYLLDCEIEDPAYQAGLPLNEYQLAICRDMALSLRECVRNFLPVPQDPGPIFDDPFFPPPMDSIAPLDPLPLAPLPFE